MDNNLFDAWYQYVNELFVRYPITMTVTSILTLIALIIVARIEQQDSQRRK